MYTKIYKFRKAFQKSIFFVVPLLYIGVGNTFLKFFFLFYCCNLCDRVHLFINYLIWVIKRYY